MPQALRNKYQISELQEEVRILRSFVIGIIGKDKEGKYNPEFVEKILQSSQEESKHTFKDSASFLKQIYKD
jgi:hypothetical protein